MCDTMIALGALTASGRVTLAKNSDREPNEAQYLTQVSAADHAPGSSLKCTYIEIPQAAHTYAVIGSRPWWIWGFEHGVNEKGLAIGNEAVWSRLAAGEEPGLLGMDLLRLTLERAADADEALDVLIGLLETYGQSGSASRTGKSFYHNSFILADGAGGWVLQTAGKHWVAKRIDGWASISNVYSIGSDYDRISADAIDYAVEQGWYDPKSGAPFDFADAYADLTQPIIPSCQSRFRMSQQGMGKLSQQQGITLQNMFDLLRSHGAGDTVRTWRPGEDGPGCLCMHTVTASGFETAASMVVELPRAGSDEKIACWVSLASPCLSAFVPFWFDAGVPQGYDQPAAGEPDQWWARERLQRLIERDYAVYAPMARSAYACLEAGAVETVAALPASASSQDRLNVSQQFADRQKALVEILHNSIAAIADGPLPPRANDPRGTYLADVQAAAVDTSLAAMR